jgi:hypothetical protein
MNVAKNRRKTLCSAFFLLYRLAVQKTEWTAGCGKMRCRPSPGVAAACQESVAVTLCFFNP